MRRRVCRRTIATHKTRRRRPLQRAAGADRRDTEGDIDAGRIPGAVIAIARHGKLVLLDAYGWRDKTAGVAMTTDTIFNIASMTQPITTVGALMLYERGNILMNDPLAKYFPKFAQMRVAARDAAGEPTGQTVPADRLINADPTRADFWIRSRPRGTHDARCSQVDGIGRTIHLARRERHRLVGRPKRRTRGGVSVGGARPNSLALSQEDQCTGVSSDHRLARVDECLFRILPGFAGNVRLHALFTPCANEEDDMKKFGYVIAAVGAIAIAAPTIASAEEMVIRHDYDRFNARAEMHRDHAWHHHHHDRVVIVKHHHHDY